MMNKEDLLTPDLLQLMHDLNDQAWLVGGCVRDFLIGAPVGDIDMATSLQPTEIIEILKNKSYYIVPTGIAHGTLTIILPNKRHVEITTFRRDVETSGRRAKVSFDTSLCEDAKRRDFTFNAMYMDAEGHVSDFFHGLQDLKAKRVRFIGNADERIREDYLRIFRFFRFWGRFGGKIPPLAAMQACRRNKAGIARLSMERKRDEFLKILSQNRAPLIIRHMDRYDVLKGFARLADDLRPLHRLIRLEQKTGLNAGVMARLMMTCPDDFLNLKLSNAQTKEISDIVEALALFPASHRHEKLIAYRLGADILTKAALVYAALTKRPISKNQIHRYKQIQAPVFPISTTDFPTLKGKKLGDFLKKAEAIWIEQGFPPQKEVVLKQISF